MAMRTPDRTGMTADEKILDEAKARFKRAEEWEATARKNYVFDMKFANGDSDNLYQWPDQVGVARIADNRPVLTINKTKQHCLQIVNDQRQNQSQMRIKPVGDGASYKAAQVFEGCCRHIEYQSNSTAAYSNASYHQVFGGMGYWRVITDYISEDSFDQEIYIRRVADPLSVYLDPDIQEADGSDADWGFVYTDMDYEDFERKYPDEAKELGHAAPFSSNAGSEWISDDYIRVTEYFYKSMKPDVLHLLDDGMVVRESDVRKLKSEKPDIMDDLKRRSVRKRAIETPDIDWCLIAGDKILERKKWLGCYIPLVRVPGEETIIDKQLDRRGHARALIDPQRIYNYWSSSAVEFVALQSKSPFITPIEAIRGFEVLWDNANVENKAYLPYNSMDEDGNPIESPERAPPPVMSQAYLDGLKIAAAEMMMASGQYEANMGQKSNEVSGTAVDARQRQGETATYHYIDRFSQSIRFTGRILLDLIPKVYDTKRVVKIMSISGDLANVQIDPDHQDAHTTMQEAHDETFDPEDIVAIFNPNVGKYDVEADIGPAYATRRQETFRALSEILQTNEQAWTVVGDLLFEAADFPMADKIAQRLRNIVPPQALGQKGPDPQLQQAQQQLAEQHKIMMDQEDKIRKLELKNAGHEADNQVDLYNAETQRLKVVSTVDPDGMKPIFRELESQILNQPINAVIAAHKDEESQWAQPPEPEPASKPKPKKAAK